MDKDKVETPVLGALICGPAKSDCAETMMM